MHYNTLTAIPGIGKSIAADMEHIGIKKPSDLKGRDPQELYELSNRYAGKVQDRCLLYVFRCAVYCVNTPKPEKHLMKWWAWTIDRTDPSFAAMTAGLTKLLGKPPGRKKRKRG